MDNMVPSLTNLIPFADGTRQCKNGMASPCSSKEFGGDAMGLLGELIGNFKGKKKPNDEDDDYADNPDENISEQDQMTLNRLIRERTRKGKKKMVEVE